MTGENLHCLLGVSIFEIDCIFLNHLLDEILQLLLVRERLLFHMLDKLFIDDIIFYHKMALHELFNRPKSLII